MQAAFLGRPSADALFKSLTHVGRDIDPRAPQAVADLTNDSLKTHPLIVELRQRRDALSKATRELYGTLKIARAAGSKEYELYAQATSDLEKHKKTLKREKREETRLNFFNTIETEDSRRQLALSAVGLSEEEWKPEPVKHSLERKRVAELLCQHRSELTPQEKLQYRIDAIKALLDLCRVPEPTVKRKVIRDRDWGILPTPESCPEPTVKFEPGPVKITNRQCLFCACKTGVYTLFCRPRKAREHVKNQHLSFFGQDESIPCPDPYCRLSGIMLFGHEHFKNHVFMVHGASLLSYTL